MTPANRSSSPSRWRSCRDVDGGSDPSSVGAYLDDLAGLPMVAAEKRRSLELLRLGRGGRCLDVGCGSGPELGQLSQRVGPEGSVVGLDRSRRLLDAAGRRHDDDAITLVEGDATALPFDDGHFDGVRADRTLQHVGDPARALREMVRVTRRGGRVVISEFRWGLVAPELERSVTDRVLAQMAPEDDRSAWIGRTLPAVAAEAGLHDPETVTQNHDVEDPAQIARLLNLSWSLPAAVDGGELTLEAARTWERALHAQAADGDAFAVIVFLHVAGSA